MDLLMRSKLFVPAWRPELYPKAVASQTDAICFDLEDAIAPERKGEARATLSGWLGASAPGSTGKVLMVRVNGLDTPHFADDLAAIVGPALDVVNLPKVEVPAAVSELAAALAQLEAGRGVARPIGILVNIESPRGLRRAAEIAAADPRVVGLQLGLADLFEPLGIDRRDTAAVHHVQVALRLAAGEAGVGAYDAAFADVRDPDGYTREAEAARRLGYHGKSCIHPSQIALANGVFRPSDAEIARARRVVTAWQVAVADGVGAVLVDGEMIDAPFARRAEAVVAAARRLGLSESR